MIGSGVEHMRHISFADVDAVHEQHGHPFTAGLLHRRYQSGDADLGCGIADLEQARDRGGRARYRLRGSIGRDPRLLAQFERLANRRRDQLRIADVREAHEPGAIAVAGGRPFRDEPRRRHREPGWPCGSRARRRFDRCVLLQDRTLQLPESGARLEPQLDKRCRPGAIAPTRTRNWVRDAMREWRQRYGRPPSSTDWSRRHARRRGGDPLERFQARDWPPASTVIDIYGSWPAAHADAFPDG